MAIVVFSPAQIEFLAALNEHKVRFIVVGLSSAVLQGAPVSTQDVDLWIENLGSEEFLRAIKLAKAFYVPPGLVGTNPPMLGPSELRLFDLVTHMHGLETFSDEYTGCLDENIGGASLKLLPVERILASKRAANRDKDIAAIPILETLIKAKDKLRS